MYSRNEKSKPYIKLQEVEKKSKNDNVYYEMLVMRGSKIS